MARTREQINAQARGYYAKRSPELVAKRRAYLHAHYRKHHPEPAPRAKMSPAERLAHRAKAERERNARLTPEQRRAKRRRAYERQQAKRPSPPPREPVLTLPVIPKAVPVPKSPRPRTEREKPRNLVRPEPLPPPVVPRVLQPETIDEWMARTGQQPEQLPGPSFAPRYGSAPAHRGMR